MKIYLGYNENNCSSIKNYNLYKLYFEQNNVNYNTEKLNTHDLKSYFNLNYLNININLCLPYLFGINNINKKTLMYIDVNYRLIKNIEEIKKKYCDTDKLFYYVVNDNFEIKFLLINTNHPQFVNMNIVNLHNLEKEKIKEIIYNNNSNIQRISCEEIFYDNDNETKRKNKLINNLNAFEKKKLNFIKKQNILYVTSFNKKLYNDYGKDFLKTFNFEGDLVLFSEEDMNFIHKELNIKYNLIIGNLFNIDKDFLSFYNRNKERNIKDAEIGFRFNAIRFSYKVFSLINAYKYFKNEKYDLMVWLDGDMIFKKVLKNDYIVNKLTDNDTLLSYLGRKNGRCYSECGFLIFNLKHNYIKKYLNEIKECYLTNKIYELDEWHDSYIWDYFRIKFEIIYKIKNFNISSRLGCKQNVNHIIDVTPLKEYLDHLKGDIRKEIKTSANKKLYNKIKKKKDALILDKQNNEESNNNEKKEKLFDVIKRQIKKKIKKEKEKSIKN